MRGERRFADALFYCPSLGHGDGDTGAWTYLGFDRYAFNRPNTSQVADAINSGRGLP